MSDWTLDQHSGIHACPLSRYMLHDQSHAACPCQCCMSMSILHVHVHVTCPCQCCMPMSMSMFIYIEMRECRTVRHPVSLDWKKLTIPEQVRYRTKLTQSGIFVVRYWTKIRDAGMPMLALVFSMPMPRYGCEAPQISAYQLANSGLRETEKSMLCKQTHNSGRRVMLKE
jgi:hypothetical protein